MGHDGYVLFHASCSVGATMHGGNRSKAKYEGCNLDDQDDWRELKNGIAYKLMILFPEASFLYNQYLLVS